MEEFRIVLADACKIVKESSRKRVISGADEDGRVMVEFSEPVGGRRVKMLTPDEINGMLYKEETSESPANAEEAMAEETEPPTAGQEENGESALERIPKDAQTGEPQYTQTDAGTAWDAIVEQTEGDKDMARYVAESTMKAKEEALKKLESSEPKAGATVTETIAAAKEHKAAIAAARQELERWKAIVEVENRRKAEEETKAEAERKAKANAEEERRKKFSANMGSRYSLSDEYADNGEAFVKNEKGSTNLIEIPHEIFDRLGISPLPFKLTESMALHVYSHHAKELKLKTLDDAIDFVLSTIGNADHVRLGRDNSYVFSVENGKDRVGKRAITIVIGDNAGEFIGIRTSGYESIKKLKERPLLWERSAKAASEDVATPTITTIESLNDDETSSRTKSQSNGSSASKVSESPETKQEKAEKSISAKVKEASADVNTEPTEAQKEAGNYKKGHVQVGTFDITIEQPEGSIRRGTDANGKQWESKMHNTYGYFRGTEGVDGDHIDVFLSNDMDGWNGAQVFVVDQYNPDGTFDEHKVMLGFNDASDAKNNYLANYKKGWEKGRRIDVSAVSLADFEKWIASSHRKTKPFSEYKSVKPADDSETFKGHKVENSGKNIEVQIKHLEEIKDYPGADKKIVQSEIDRLKAEKEAMAKSKNVQGTNKTGAFGTIYTQFKGKAKEAIAFLLEKKEGEAVGALHHKDIGDIDLVWGTEGTGKSDGFGLAKLVKYHPEVLDDLQEILDDMTVVKKNANRVQLESKTHKASVRLAWDEEKKNWLLTAYEKKNSASDNTTDTAETAMSGKRNDTATPQNTVSMGKVSESPETKQEKKEKSEEPKSEEENGVDDAKIDTVLEALDKGKEKAARRLASKLTNKELSKARSKAKPSFLLEYEWQWRAQNRGDVSLHDWMLENQYVEPVKRVSGTFRITDYTASKDSPYAERLGGVYHDDKGYAVASDGIILVADKGSYDPKLKGKVIGKDGAAMENKFPDWQKIIPVAEKTKSSRIDAEDLHRFVAGVLKADKHAYISLRFPDGTTVSFGADKLNLMLRAMKQLGTSELLYTKNGSMLVAKSDKGAALLMWRVYAEDESMEEYGYAYPGNTVSYQRGEVVGETSQEERVLRDAVIDRLRESGMEVITDEEAGQRVLDEANGKAKLSAKKRRALETASLGKTPRSLTVVSSADGANVLKSIDSLVSEFEKSAVQPKTFIGDVAKALGAKRGGSASEYASFETKNGKIITIRLSNHNAKVSNFDANGETDGISIVVSPKKSGGMTNDGKAHVVEYYYDAIKLRRAEGKPLADIVRSIKQALYSGEFEDTTGLAERQEVNAEITDRVRFFRTAKGEAYGFTVGGKIYIDPKIANTETPIHEYAHLWAAALRGQNPKEWRNIVELMKGTSVWDEVKKRYPELNTDDDIADEVLATYSGRRGAERLREEQRKIAGDKGGVFEKAEAISALERVKQALRKFWKSVADFLHIHYKSAEEVADRVMKDLLDGVDPGKHFNSRNDDPRFMFAGETEARNVQRRMSMTAEERRASLAADTEDVARDSQILLFDDTGKNMSLESPKEERIEKLRESKPVEITGEEITPSDDLKQYKRNALEYGKKLRGVYTNEDTGEQIELTGGNRRGGLREILQHDYKDKEHLQSIAAIPQIIEKAIFIDELPNEDRKNYPGVRAFRYYVCGLKIADVDYTVKAVIAEQNNGERYYDHKLTKIEKGKLLSIIPTIQKAGMDSDLPRSAGKDSRLLSILQVKDEKKPNDGLYRVGGGKELRDGRKIEFVRKPTATYNALARHLQAEGIKPDMHEARTGSRYMSFEKDGVQWEVRSSGHTKPEYYGEAQKPVELTYYKDKQGEENLSVSVDLGTSGYNIEDMKALMAEIGRLKNDAGEVKESFDKGVASDEVVERYPLLSQALGVKSENEVRAKEEAREHAEEARKQEMRSAVEDMAGKLHLNNVDIVDKPAGRGAGRRERAKGMFERSTGRITINTGNCADKRDAVVTLLHEAVAHHGLRKLFGENFETFLDNVYNSANAKIRRIIDKHSHRYDGDKRTATEEYMASLAERTDFDNAKKSGWWQRIKDFFLKMLEKIGLKGFKGEDLSDNELRYVLWRSYENLKSGGKDTVFSAADDLAKQSELKVGEFAPDAKKTAPEENAEEVNERFNNELTRYQSGDMDKNEMLHLGRPQGVMRTFLPNLPIVVRQRILKKGSEKKHNIDVAALANMPRHLSSPIFVFQRSDNALGVLTEMQDRDGKNICVAIELNRQIQNGGEMLEVNDIRSVHGRNVADIVYPIVQNGTLKWADKEKGLAYLSSASRYVQQEIDRPDLSTAAKVVENFENPKPESKNDILFRDGDAKDYEKAQARDRYERRVRSGLFQSREALQDSMLSLKVAMDAIEEATAGKAKRIEDYDGFENAYLGENRLSSVNQAESTAFAHLLIRPIMEEVNRLAPTAEDRAELIDYMFAKHGLERNAYMRQQAAEKKLAEYKKQNPGTAKTAADFIDAERDYAGLTTLTGEADVSAAEAEAQRMVAEYEKDYTFHGTWNEIYVCRKKIC